MHTNTKMIEFNINHFIRVKLTEHGKNLLAAHPYEIRYTEDSEGWSRWQTWQLMAYLGSEMYNGCRVPFEPTIMIEVNERS